MTGAGPCRPTAAPTQGVVMGALTGCILAGFTLEARTGAVQLRVIGGGGGGDGQELI